MPVTVTKPEIKEERDSQKRLTGCRICARIENRTAGTVTRSISFYQVSSDGSLEHICTQDDIEVVGLVKNGDKERWGSVEVCCRIPCPDGKEKFLVAVGTQLDPNNYVEVDRADDKKETETNAIR
jgi:hypothetical protein